MTIKTLHKFLMRKYNLGADFLQAYESKFKSINLDDICLGMKVETIWNKDCYAAFKKVIINLNGNEKYYR